MYIVSSFKTNHHWIWFNVYMKNLALYFFLLLVSISYSQENQNSFVYNYFSSKNGLSNNYVSKVVSDSLNVKWIATENGIAKYDGLNFYTIRPGDEYPGLTNENIETLFIDSKNNLWIGTKSGGLSMLEIKTNKLSSYNSAFSKNLNGSLRIMSIVEDELGNIWLGTRYNGIFVIDPIEKRVLQNIKSSETRFIKKGSKGNIWFCQNSNLKKYSPTSKETSTYEFGEVITSLVEDTNRNCLWIGVVNNKKKHRVIKFDLATEKFTEIQTGIPAGFTTSLYLDRHQNLWVGTWGKGLYKSASDVQTFEKMNLVYPPDIKKNNNFEIILDIHEDSNNVIWISSDFGGIVTLSENKGFSNLDRIVENPILKNETNIHSIYQDESEVYLGTIRSGLFFGASLEELEQHKATIGQKIFAISTHDSSVLVAKNNAVIFLDQDKNVVNEIKISQPTSFFSEDKNTLWVGTQQNGLFKYKIDGKNNSIADRFTTQNPASKIQSMRITAIVNDPQNNMWVGTYNGLHLYDKETKQFIHHSKLLSDPIPNIINAVFIDSDHIWLGTSNGLYKLTYTDGKLETLHLYNAQNTGLKNDFICGISSDNQGYLWVTTTNNIVRFDKYNDSFINYGEDDGIHSSVFNLRSLYSNLKKSIVYAGGTDNLTFFNPEEIASNDKVGQLIFTHLKINNEKVDALEKVHDRVVLENDFSYSSSIELTHREKSFAIGFTDTDFLQNSSLRYRYKLVGLDDTWNYLKNQNEINFVGLSAGRYQLLISASGDFQKWSKPIVMDISVLHAPWAGPMAYTLYFILILLVVSGLVYGFMRQIHLRDRLEKEKELSESKFTFFTNISHEFRTPLTLILGPLKELIQRKDLKGEVSDKLSIMEKNADRLLNLITQLLDFRKAEHGLLYLEAKNGNIVRFSNEVFLYFKEQASLKNIKYEFSSDKAEIILPFDRNKMEIALCNLISNALKYTKSDDQISLNISSTNDSCRISIKDTGYGMDKKSKLKIFDRFYQIKSTNTTNIIGSGIGLSFTKKIIELHQGTIEVDSKIDQGTEFVIEIPLHPILSNDTSRYSTDTIENYKQIDNEVHSNLNIDAKENTILVVDDNEDIRKYLKEFLKDEYNILEARDGVEGIDLAIKENPDLLLCDIMMPRKDGLAVTKELKSQIKTSHIPIILLTARSSNLYEIQGLETGADDFITKPFDPQVIKARITSVLQNRIKTREHFLNKIRFEPIKTDEEEKDLETEFIRDAILLVEDNLNNESFDIKVMMDKMNMSQSTLYRKIKSLSGLSLTGFIRSVRLKKAAEMILSSNEKLNSIAFNVGFNDYKYFRESFKKQYGCLPSEYKAMKK